MYWYKTQDIGLFKAILKSFSNVEVVIEASDGREILESLKHSKPDIVLLDINMPELNGLDATKLIKKYYPEIKVVILSMYCSEETIKYALLAGADGYMVKDSLVDELEVMLHAVAAGNIYITPSVAKGVVNEYLTVQKSKEKKVNSVFFELSFRQREILQLLVEGNSIKEIAYKLKLSAKTVDTQKRNIMDKLRIHNIPDLVRYAIRNKLLAE